MDIQTHTDELGRTFYRVTDETGRLVLKTYQRAKAYRKAGRSAAPARKPAAKKPAKKAAKKR